MKVIDIPSRAECVECPWMGEYHESGGVNLAVVEALEHLVETGHYAKVCEAPNG